MIFADPIYFLSGDSAAFVWFTDGLGWKDARKNLKETFSKLKTMYNISDLENEIIRILA